jgi:hypothetical protein
MFLLLVLSKFIIIFLLILSLFIVSKAGETPRNARRGGPLRGALQYFYMCVSNYLSL